MKTSWLLFTWNLVRVTRPPALVPDPLVLKIAEKSDEREVLSVVARSFSFDQQWSGLYSRFAEPLEQRIQQAFRSQTIAALALMHGSRFIAVSCLSTDENAASHLLSGPCVLPEYRSRGLASVLLEETLHRLQQSQLGAAHGVCVAGTTASKFVYPKFGSVQEIYPHEPFSLV